MSIFQGKVLLVKKLEIEKTKPTFTLKTLKVVYSVGLLFSIFNFFINKNSQGRESVREKKYLLLQIRLYFAIRDRSQLTLARFGSFLTNQLTLLAFLPKTVYLLS